MTIAKEKISSKPKESLEERKLKFAKLKEELRNEEERIKKILNLLEAKEENEETKNQVNKMKEIVKKHNRKKSLLKILKYNIKYKI
jgi:hypothetical protein